MDFYIILKHFGDFNFIVVKDYNKDIFYTPDEKVAKARVEGLQKHLQGSLVEYKAYKLTEVK